MLGRTSKKIRVIRKQRVGRVRAKIQGTAERPRLAVFRSLKHISAQLVDDVAGRTLAAASDSEVKKKMTGVERATAVGAMLAEKAVAKGVKQVVFDRRWYQYHGQVAALAEAAREKGLVF